VYDAQTSTPVQQLPNLDTAHWLVNSPTPSNSQKQLWMATLRKSQETEEPDVPVLSACSNSPYLMSNPPANPHRISNNHCAFMLQVTMLEHALPLELTSPHIYFLSPSISHLHLVNYPGFVSAYNAITHDDISGSSPTPLTPPLKHQKYINKLPTHLQKHWIDSSICKY
jgi:hypothetical protein